jgi:hypothetical protein
MFSLAQKYWGNRLNLLPQGLKPLPDHPHI